MKRTTEKPALAAFYTSTAQKEYNLTAEPFCTMLRAIASEKTSGAIFKKVANAQKWPVRDKPDVMNDMGHLPERIFGQKYSDLA